MIQKPSLWIVLHVFECKNYPYLDHSMFRGCMTFDFSTGFGLCSNLHQITFNSGTYPRTVLCQQLFERSIRSKMVIHSVCQCVPVERATFTCIEATILENRLMVISTLSITALSFDYE